MRAVLYIPDLLFGSGVVEGLRSAGHEPVLVARPDELAGALADAQLLVVDLTAEAGERIAAVSDARPAGLPTLAFYSHVESDVRAAAERAGFDRVVPRSRMAREGVELMERLSQEA